MEKEWNLREDANIIIKDTLFEMLPDKAVKKALEKIQFSKGKLILIAIGKAAWQMADTASKYLNGRITKGIVITKYGHINGQIPKIKLREAGHPVPDRNSFSATKEALEMVNGLSQDDTVLFLLSGGGSSLFEWPLVDESLLEDLTDQLLRCGADIVEINTVRKRLSAVKGGKFAKACEPAHVCNIILSDIIGDPLDMIASGPTSPDSSTSDQAMAVITKYDLKINKEIETLLQQETPKKLKNTETYIIGSVRHLCEAAAKSCEGLGYHTNILTTGLCCEAKDAGSFLASLGREHNTSEYSVAYIAGGETVVHVKGKGKGGRNQEIALASAVGISGLNNVAIFSIGSDGTDGPTDAAGGFVDGNTINKLKEKKINVDSILKNNDAYMALKECGGLIITGPTGTNVNDVSILLIKAEKNTC